MKSRLLLTTGVMLLATAIVAASPPTVSFRRDIAPLFAKDCAVCHLKEGPVAGLVLEPRLAYSMIVDVPSGSSSLKRIAPGDPEQSYLLLKMENRHRAGGGTGDKMPPGWLSVTPVEIELVRVWIAEGARDN